MKTDNIELIEPCELLSPALGQFLAEYEGNPRDVDGLGWLPDGGPGEMIRQLQDRARGINLPDGFVPASTYWLVRDGMTILGQLCLRHRLNEKLREVGGHVGYSIRPSERGKDYATQMLSLALQKARQLGLRRVLITCDKINAASARVIEKNSGILEREIAVVYKGKPCICRHYWIEL